MPLLADPDPTIESRLDLQNAALAAAGCRWSIQIRGGRLCLRGPLPMASGGGGLRMQRLSLGLPADGAGLERALQRLAEVRWQLDHDQFDWMAWRRRQPLSTTSGVAAAPALVVPPLAVPPLGVPPLAVPASRSAGPAPALPGSGIVCTLPEPLAGFERAFFSDPRRRRRRAGSRTTWTAAYLPYLRRLAARLDGAPPDLPLLEEVLESYALATRSRQQCAIALAALARHHGIPLPPDWNERAAGYGLHAARFRQLPSDGEILALVEQIPNPSWRLAYGLMATYGLRNHEVFFCDCSPLAAGADRVIRVLPTSKTGEHQVWPFQPEWVDHFGLEQLATDRSALPPVRTDLPGTTLQQVGRRVAEQFRRYGLPLTPYDLRHAWAVRTIHIGLPDTVAARMMGHSVAIHTRTYHHWITRRDQQQAVDTALERQRVA